MKKLMMPMAGALGAVIALSGCYSPKVSYTDYPTTAFAEVAIKKNATLKIVSSDGAVVSGDVIAKLKEEISKSKSFTVTDGAAEYWMIVDGISDSRVDSADEQAYTEKAEVVVIGAQDGKPGAAHNEIGVKKQVSCAIAKSVSVSIYEAATLTPVHYFEIPVYSGSVGDGKTSNEKVLKDKDAELTEEIVGRVKDVFITQTKTIKVPVPNEASSAMREAMAGKSAAKDVPAAAKQAIPQPFDAFMSDVQAGKYKGKKSELTTKLCDYYVLAIAREMGCLDAKVLKELHAQHVALLQNATIDSLALACPVALARIEYKLSHLGAK